MMIKVLVADDDSTFCLLVCDLLKREGYDALSAQNVEQCYRTLKENDIQILMLDMCFPALQDGFGVLDTVRQEFPNIVVLMISGEGNIPDAVNAIKNGATDFIEKPIAPEHLLLRLHAVVTRFKMEAQIRELSHSAIGMISASSAMRKVYDDVIRASKYDCPVLVSGETGVGKELVARAIHRLSDCKNRELVVINCGAIPKELFESELFGHEAGAFTGANKAKKGYFEHAHGAAVFLDEVSELPLEVQVKLLRVLSEKEIQKVGGKVQKVEVRVFSATNRDLKQLVDEGLFREDLYYRLNTINIHVPPLRERKEDVLPLATHFINQVCAENSIAPLNIQAQAQNWLLEQDWRGNVRELKNVIYRGVVFAAGEQITVSSLQQKDITETDDDDDISLRLALRRYERNYILETLKTNDFNVPITAKVLNMDKSNLFKRIKALGIDLRTKS